MLEMPAEVKTLKIFKCEISGWIFFSFGFVSFQFYFFISILADFLPGRV